MIQNTGKLVGWLSSRRIRPAILYLKKSLPICQAKTFQKKQDGHLKNTKLCHLKQRFLHRNCQFSERAELSLNGFIPGLNSTTSLPDTSKDQTPLILWSSGHSDSHPSSQKARMYYDKSVTTSEKVEVLQKGKECLKITQLCTSERQMGNRTSAWSRM